MDVIIPLSAASIKNKDVLNTISNIRNFQFDRIFICSKYEPQYGIDAIWLQAPDLWANKDANQIDAIFTAIKYGISANFLRCSDDERLECQYPVPKHAGEIICQQGGRWQRRLNNTYSWLKMNGFTTYNYDTHTPKIYNKEKFIEIFNKSPYQGHVGLTIESNYFNQL